MTGHSGGSEDTCGFGQAVKPGFIETNTGGPGKGLIHIDLHA